MNEELVVLLDVVKRFNDTGIPYMVTGSVAMNYYAIPRMTRDIDLVIEISREQVEKLEKVFENDYYISVDAVLESVRYSSSFNLIHNEFQIKIDCMIRKQNEYRILEFSKRKKIAIDGSEIFIVGKEDLILSKLFWAKDNHSERQLDDVRNLLQTGYDKEYVGCWSNKLGVFGLLMECLNE